MKPHDAPGKGALTRRRIVQEALVLFADKGVDQTTMKDIASGAGITEPAVYRHFSGKAELVWQIFSEGYCGLALELQAAASRETGLRQKLERIIDVYCLLHDTSTPLFRFLFLTQHGQLARLTPGMPTPVDVVRDVIAAGIEAREIPKGDPDLLTALLFGLVTQPAVFRIYGRLDGRMQDYAGILTAASWAVLSARG